jgi:hypothetical protein
VPFLDILSTLRTSMFILGVCVGGGGGEGGKQRLLIHTERKPLGLLYQGVANTTISSAVKALTQVKYGLMIKRRVQDLFTSS